MSLSKEDKFDHAARLVLLNTEDPEFCLVYEDPELEDLSEDEQKEIHDLMCLAKITVTFDGRPDVYGAVEDEIAEETTENSSLREDAPILRENALGREGALELATMGKVSSSFFQGMSSERSQSFRYWKGTEQGVAHVKKFRDVLFSSYGKSLGMSKEMSDGIFARAWDVTATPRTVELLYVSFSDLPFMKY